MAGYRLAICQLCGKSFNAFASSARFCSPECRFKNVASRFTDPLSCWDWPLRITRNGYGHFFWSKRPVPVKRGAHRVAHEVFNGPIPGGLVVMHTCDNKKCINPSHLIIGTQLDNVHDMHAKGRARSKGHRQMPARQFTKQMRLF